MEIGNTLRAARESMGVSLETAEEKTKIRRKYLEALENENYGLLPGRVYVKGFLKNYSRYLGLNPETLVSAYEESIPMSDREEDPAVREITRNEKRERRGLNKLVLLLAAAILVAAVIYLPSLAGYGKAIPPGTGENKVAGEKNPTDQSKTAPEVKPEQGKSQAQPQKQQQGVSITLNVTDNQSWLYVEVDGKPVFTGLVPAGQIKEFKGNEKILLRIGNAGVVQVEYNGQKMGVLGGINQVVTKEFKAPQV